MTLDEVEAEIEIAELAIVAALNALAAATGLRITGVDVGLVYATDFLPGRTWSNAVRFHAELGPS
ncbi:MAG TPA: hypothetical protein VGB88_15490 [Alphaproteobacteria bacterium]